MNTQCTKNRAKLLVEAASNERESSFRGTLQTVRSNMNARNLYPSSSHVTEICNSCQSELRERAKIIWECIRRAHESCGSDSSEDLHELFTSLLQFQRLTLEQMQAEFSDNVVRQLQNKSLIQQPLQSVSNAFGELLAQYEAEIAIFIDNLKRGKGDNNFERMKSRLLNSKPVAAVALIILAIGTLAALTEGLGKLSTFVSDWKHAKSAASEMPPVPAAKVKSSSPVSTATAKMETAAPRLASPREDWADPQWNDARANIAWVLQRDMGAKRTYDNARSHGASKYFALLTAQAHSKSALESIAAFGEPRTEKYVASLGH